MKLVLGMEVGFSPGRFVLDGDPAPPPQKVDRAPPNFRLMFIATKRLDEAGTWHGGRPQPRRLCVRWGPSSLPPKRGGAPPQFSAHFYCGQTVGQIKIKLGMEVGLGPGDFVLDGDPAPLLKRGRSPLPNFLPMFIVAKRLDG